jgi:hypothetical protein
MEILSSWALDSYGYNVQRVLLDYAYPGLVSCEDTTRTPTTNIPNDPNQVVCRIVGQPEVLDEIIAAQNYTIMPGTRQAYTG